MPNPQIDKVNVNGTLYDIIDSTSPAASISASDIENWDNKVDSQSEYNNETTQIINEGGAINTTAWGSNQALSIHLDSQSLTIHDPIGEVEYIHIYPYSGGSDEFVHITSVQTPVLPKDAVNKQYVDASIAAIDIPTVPSNVSAFTNDAGYITTETDPTVPSWAKASQKPTYTASEVGAVAITSVGAASGVAPLNASSKIDESYLPSYVDDVIEGYYYNNKFWKESTHTTEIAGEAGKIYVDLTTDKTYRFGGTAFVEISSGTTVSVVRDLTSGTKVGTITVNGTGTDLYAPTPPSKVSELTNDSGFISGISAADVSTALGYTPYNSTNPNGYVNAAGASAAAPVQSVNGQTGAVTLSAADVGALPSNTTIPTVTDTYSSSGTDAISGKGVYAAIQTLDSSITATANSAISAITITDGKITASSKIAIPIVPTNVSAFTNDAGYITGIDSSDVTTALGYTPISAETDPIFSASAAAGISAADITSWNNKVSDDHKWNDVELNKSEAASNDDYYLTALISGGTSATTARLVKATTSPSSNRISKYNAQGYLVSTTPSSDDNTTKVATTAFVKTVLPTVPSNVSAFSNDAGYVTSSEAASAAPVQSVNGQTGAVTITDSDEKLKTSAVSETSAYYLIFGSANNTASTKFYDTNLKYQSATDATLTLGSLNGKKGCWQIFNGGYYISLQPSTLTAARTIYLPDKGGTVALISDIPTVPTNVSSFSNDVGYITLADLPIYDGTVQTGT